MTILVLNTGSSSVKFELFDVDANDQLNTTATGLVEGIGEETGRARAVLSEATRPRGFGDKTVPDHRSALDTVVNLLDEYDLLADLRAIGHRMVHGGEAFTAPTVLDDDVIARLDALSTLAPLHNPPALTGIAVARELRPDVPHVAVFDTAFHATLDPVAYTYAVPGSWYRDHGVRRYGFHGTSHGYVAGRAAAALDRPLDELKLISLHLGNGASACAIDGGRSVDTSMGLSPLEGLVMGTRSGDLDPAVVFHMIRAGMTPDEVESDLNRASGLTGLAGDNDLRHVLDAANGGDQGAVLALSVMTRRIHKYLGAYLAVLGGLDVVVFTGGIGEHSATVRRQVVEPLGHLGLRLDARANTAADAPDEPVTISPAGTAPAVLVIATDEEWMIANQVLGVI